MNKVAVIRYENIAPSEHITEKMFSEQIEWLIKNNIRILTLNEFDRYMKGELSLSKAVLIVKTASFLDSYVWAYPVLKQYNVPAVLFVDSWEIEEDECAGFSSSDIPKISYAALSDMTLPKSGIYEGKKIIRRSRLSWQEIKTMSAGLISCQPGGMFIRPGFIDDKIDGFITDKSHLLESDDRLGALHFKEGSLLSRKAFLPNPAINDKLHQYVLKNGYISFFGKPNWKKELQNILPNPPYGRFETDDEYYIRVKNHFAMYKGEIQTETNKKTDSFFWPFGDYSSKSIEIAKEVGFHLFFTKQKGYAEVGKSDAIASFAPSDITDLKKLML